MGLSVVAQRMLRVAAIITLASAAAYGGGTPAAGAAGLTRTDAAAPVPTSPILAGVSCPTASMCMIVGSSDGGLAATWNGRSWRWMAPPPVPAFNSGLTAVTCPSATRCIAVGNTAMTLDTGVGFGDEWNGKTWRAMAPMAGPTFTVALGVSCATAAYCIAVGGSGGSAPLTNAIAEFWNGSSWTRMTPIIPAGTIAISLYGVSCTSTSHCVAVGTFSTHSGKFALAETWNGSTWTMQAAPAGISAFVGVDCPRANRCLAVGGATERPAAALWNGSRWHALITPKREGFRPTLTGVSCASATSCVAVGGNTSNSFADAWRGGTSLKTMSIRNPGGAFGSLYSVSCPRSIRCLAVGGPFNYYSFGNNLAFTWNGIRWRAIRENKSDYLAGVSCASSSDCIAVGSYLTPSVTTSTLGQVWNGHAWRLANPPGRVGGVSAASCVNRRFCMATGVDKAATWNGSRWKALTAGTSNLEFATVVSCVSRGFCVATGTQYAMAMWNGLKWRSANFAYPSSAASVDMHGVSCTNPSFCVAVGDYSTSFEGVPAAPLANIWNGHKWQLVSTPNPGGNSFLTAISCVSQSACMAVGLSFDAHQVGHNLAMSFKAGKWLAVAMPGPASPYGSSVSCSRATSCVSVGHFSSAGQGMADVWNGTVWRLTKPATSAALPNSVSCTTPTFCIAVGSDGNLQLTERWNGRAWKLLTETNP